MLGLGCGDRKVATFMVLNRDRYLIGISYHRLLAQTRPYRPPRTVAVRQRKSCVLQDCCGAGWASLDLFNSDHWYAFVGLFVDIWRTKSNNRVNTVDIRFNW